MMEINVFRGGKNMLEEMIVSLSFMAILVIVCIISNYYSKKEEEKKQERKMLK